LVALCIVVAGVSGSVLDVTLISERTYKLNLITFLTRFLGFLSACQDTGQTTPVILAIDPWDCSSLHGLPYLSSFSEAG
jgi:hypothetical protein